MKVQNQKSSNYKDENYKKKLQDGKPEMTYITGDKTLLTLVIFVYFPPSFHNIYEHLKKY